MKRALNSVARYIGFPSRLSNFFLWLGGIPVVLPLIKSLLGLSIIDGLALSVTRRLESVVTLLSDWFGAPSQLRFLTYFF
jgi:hypothetical protein